MSQTPAALTIRAAVPDDVPHILAFIRELADYEKLTHEVSATEELLHTSLFGPRPFAEALIGCVNGQPAGFAVFLYCRTQPEIYKSGHKLRQGAAPVKDGRPT